MGWKIVVLVCEMSLHKKVFLVSTRLDRVYPFKQYTLTHIVFNGSESRLCPSSIRHLNVVLLTK
jgi:hypothetical protein